MKKITLTIASLSLLTFFSLTACGEKEQQSAVIIPSPEATKLTETEKPEQTPEKSLEREAYQQQVTSELHKLNSQIDQLQIQARQSEALAREKLNKRTNELTKKMQLRSQLNAELESDMNELMQQLQQQSGSNVQLNDLIQKQALLQQKIEALLVADEQTWEQTQLEVDETLTTLKQSYKEVQSEPIVTESSPIQSKSIKLSPTESNSTESDVNNN